MISIEASVSKGWLAREAGVSFDGEYYLDPEYRHRIDLRCHGFVRRELSELGILYTESNLGRRRFHRESQVLVGGIQPNMILGMLLGAELIPSASLDADITPNCLAGVELEELPSPRSLLEHELVRTLDAQIDDLRDRREGRRRPIPPFFWDVSGRPAIHGALTTGQKLLGESFLMDLLLDPPRCRAVTEWIVEAYVTLVRHFAEMGEMTIEELHVGECSACLVNPVLFEQFVVPGLELLARELGPVRLHSCGPSDHLLDGCAKIAGLSSLDLGGETSLAAVRSRFGGDFPVSIAPLATDLSRKDPEPVLAWARRVLEENDDGELTVLYHLEPEYDLLVVKALDALLRGRGAVCLPSGE